jgi:acyl-CoA thioesterase-1
MGTLNKLAAGVGLCCQVVVSAAAVPGEARAAQSSSNVSTKLPIAARRAVVLGDSLAVSPSRAGGFPAELQSRIATLELPWTIVNAGVGGDTTAGGVRRVDALLDKDVEVLVLALGANDGLRGVPIADIEKNLSAIIERAHERGVRVLLCGMETPPFRGWDYTLAFHNIFPRLAAKYGVPLVPFLLDGVALVPEMNGHDGIHPNGAGAQRIAASVWRYLEPLLRGASPVRATR